MRVVSLLAVSLVGLLAGVQAHEYGPSLPPAPQMNQFPGPQNGPQNNNWNFRSWLSNAFKRTPQNELSCKYTDPVSGTNFDLTKARKAQGDYNGADMRFRYAMNFCGPANTPGPCALHKGSVCQFSTLSGSYVANLGSWSNSPPPQFAVSDSNNPSAGLTLTYANGDTCFINRAVMPRKTIVHLMCGDSDDTSFTINEIPNMCTFHIRYRTTAACGLGSSASATLIKFLVIVLVVAAIYIAAGCFYNVRFHEKKWGKLDTIPNYDFWLAVPGYAGAAATWSYETATERWRQWRGKDGGDYAPVAGSEEDAGGAPHSAVDDHDGGVADL